MNCYFNEGFGVEQLRDNSMETYWQSDGQLPHLVNIQFPRKTTISQGNTKIIRQRLKFQVNSKMPILFSVHIFRLQIR